MVSSDLISLITDVLNVFTKGKDKYDGYPKEIAKIQKRNSIKQQSSGLVCQYPMLVSNGIGMETTQMICKALEHEYANLLVLILNSAIIKTVDGDDNIADYLKNFHTNYGYRGPMDIATESTSLSNSEFEKINRELCTPFEETINMKNLNSYSYPSSILKEAENSSRNAAIIKNDYKKLNDLAPTLICCKVKFVEKDTKAETEKDVKFGVKGIVHPLLTEDVVYYLSDTVKDKNRLFRFIQWTTGEIKLFRDLLTSSDSMKKQALDSTSKNTFWWRKLKSLSQNHTIRGLLGKSFKKDKQPIPTATMIISKQDVDMIKAKHGIDLLNTPSNAYKIVREFFLLGFVVLDDSTEMAYIFNETSRQYDYYTYNALKNYSKDDNNADVNKSMFK